MRHGWNHEVSIMSILALIIPPLGWSPKVKESRSQRSRELSHEVSIVSVFAIITPPLGWSRELTIVLVHTLITPPLGWSQKVDESMSHGWSHEFSIVWVVLTLITPPIKMELRSQGDQGVLDGVMNSVLCGSCTHSLHHLLASIMFHFVFSIMTSSVHS